MSKYNEEDGKNLWREVESILANSANGAGVADQTDRESKLLTETVLLAKSHFVYWATLKQVGCDEALAYSLTMLFAQHNFASIFDRRVQSGVGADICQCPECRARRGESDAE